MSATAVALGLWTAGTAATATTAAVAGSLTFAGQVVTGLALTGLSSALTGAFGSKSQDSAVLNTSIAATPIGSDGEDAATRQRAALRTGDPASASAILTEDAAAAKKSKFGE